jgi:hypothetical protein
MMYSAPFLDQLTQPNPALGFGQLLWRQVTVAWTGICRAMPLSSRADVVLHRRRRETRLRRAWRRIRLLMRDIDFRTAVAKIADGIGAEIDGGPRVGAVSNKNQLGDREARNRELAW